MHGHSRPALYRVWSAGQEFTVQWNGLLLSGRLSVVRERSQGLLPGYHMRKRLSREIPDLEVAVLEDALAIGAGVLIIALAAPD
jgi:uncharacterized membrane protein